jgi:hypothetical protein
MLLALYMLAIMDIMQNAASTGAVHLHLAWLVTRVSTVYFE